MHYSEWLFFADVVLSIVFFINYRRADKKIIYLGLLCLLLFGWYNATIPGQYDIRIDLLFMGPINVLILGMTILRFISKVETDKAKNTTNSPRHTFISSPKMRFDPLLIGPLLFALSLVILVYVHDPRVVKHRFISYVKATLLPDNDKFSFQEIQYYTDSKMDSTPGDLFHVLKIKVTDSDYAQLKALDGKGISHPLYLQVTCLDNNIVRIIGNPGL